MGKFSIEARANSGPVEGITSRSIVKNCPLLTAEEERNLLRRAQAGDQEASTCLVLSNLRFVYWVAQRKCRQTGRFDLLDDFFQEGAIGLAKAVKTFDFSKSNDPENPFRFLTHAGYSVRGAINRCCQEQKGTIREPEQHGYLRAAIARATELLEQEGLPTTPENIAECLLQRRAAGQLSYLETENKAVVLVIVNQILTQPAEVASLDARRAVDDDRDLYETVTTDGTEESSFIMEDLRRALIIMAQKKPMLARIIRSKFGPVGEEESFLNEVDAGNKIVEQRVHRRLEKAFRLLRELMAAED